LPPESSSAVRVLRSALCLGLAAGGLEVGLRAAPRLGMSSTELLSWLAIAALLSVLYTLAAALALLLLRRLLPWVPALGLSAGALLWVHAALFYRFELFVNAFARDPVVWGGLSGVSLAALLAGWLLDKPMRAAGGWLDIACLAPALLGALAALVFGRAPPPPAALDHAGPNVLVISVDTLRSDALEPYGAAIETPTASRLAREGTLFEQAVATAPLTEPSHLAMLSGLEPVSSGVVSNGTAFGEQPALVPHAFQAAGYATGGFVAGFPLHGRWGWTQGFDVYDDDFGSMPGLHRLSIVKAWDQLTLPAHTLRERPGDAVLARAQQWLGRVEQDRWFLWLHLFDPHGPYEAPPPFAPTSAPPTDGEPLELPAYWPPPHRAITDLGWIQSAYEGEVRYVDHLLGKLMDQLEQAGVLDDTLVLLVADHGESLTEHDYLFDHGDYLYDASLRVPLIARLPGTVLAGQRVPCQVSTVDVAPTLLALAGLDDGVARDGRSLLSVLAGATCSEGDMLSTTVAGRMVEVPPVDHALRGHGRKLIQHEQGGVELFDLRADPGETRELSASEPQQARALGLVLEARLEGQAEIQAPSQDEGTQDALRALGYIE